MHYYVVLAVTALPYFISNLLFAADPLIQKTVVYLTARSLTALMGTGCVLLTFLLGRLLFNIASGLIAALFLTLTMGFVSIAHFATVDIPMLFWMMLSFLMAGLVLRAGDRRFYVMAGVFAGFAAATKYVGGIALLTLIVAYLLRTDKRDHAGILWGVVASAVAFVLTNPPLLIWSCEFFEGFVMDNAVNSLYRRDLDAVPLVRSLVRLDNALGTALSVSVCAALIYSARLLFHTEWSRSIILIGSMWLPFLLLISNVHYPSIRHYVPLAPPLLLLVGKMMADLLAARRRLAARAGLVVGAAAIAYSGLYTLSATLQFTGDAREQATHWLRVHLRQGSTIEVTPLGPTIPTDEIVVIKRPVQRPVKDTLASLQQTGVYRVLYPAYAGYKSWAENIGLCPVRERHYFGWYDKYLANERTRNFDPSMAGLEDRRPDMLIISYYEPYEVDLATTEGQFYAALFAGNSNYEEVATFKYRFLPWFDPQPEYINPTVRIFQRRSDEPHA